MPTPGAGAPNTRVLGRSHVLFAELVRTVAAIIPPPGRHVVKYFGVLSSGRRCAARWSPALRLELGVGAALGGADSVGVVLQQHLGSTSAAGVQH